MQDLTIGEISVFIAFAVAFISGATVLYTQLKKWLNALFREQLTAIDKSMAELEERIDAVDLETCKNYLVTFLSGVEKGASVDEIERERFFEQYSHYSKCGGNSYIKHKVEKLTKEGKI